MSPAAIAIQAVKKIRQIGRDAALRFAVNRGASARAFEIAERVECNRRIKAIFGEYMA